MVLERFTEADLELALWAILKTNTQHYRSDFLIDKSILRWAAGSKEPLDKMLLWFSRPCGTFCGWEKDVFTKGTYENQAFCFYSEQLPNERVLAYAVEITGAESGRIQGNLYMLDYRDFVGHVRVASVPEKYRGDLRKLLRFHKKSRMEQPVGSLSAHIRRLDRRNEYMIRSVCNLDSEE